ncbi:MAG: tetratricopeptide repeat protein [Lachnospiraceae bacterium]|nr:tetratricopeptide repeat protein [Lachnospiraceae bacterium]MDD7434878.1 tetratricopeptide repeat protein [Lachnospiraceae bacterium]MDY3341620.1 tetratricopeptide repeat protein [Lachnospiraceae bacterium]
MRCIYCGTPLSAIDYCTGCGADVTLQKRIVRISNLLYNEGLEKASVRDLSGAISCLKRSLKFNKENIDARNLLGLVYYETGEVVSALSEWVISKNTVEENNAADFYIAKLQSNKNKLETINQTIKKYNQALLYCKQDDEDMAVIQLKKVLSQNPNLIKAYHLLALIYMKQQEYEKARKLLKKAAQIDTTNTTTLRYLHEVEEATGVGTNLNKSSRRFRKTVDGEEKEPHLLGPVTYKNGNDIIIQPTTFRDSSTMATFLNIFMGFVLGAALIWFLGIPANTRKINQEASKSVTDANTKLASETAKVTSLEKEIEDYQAKVDEANNTMQAAQDKADGYDTLLKAANEFISGDQNAAGNTLGEIEADSMEGEARTLYESLLNSVKGAMYSSLYSQGATAYSSGDYKTAAEALKKATEADPTQYDAWYYLAFSYYNLNDTENADKTLAETIVRFPQYEELLSSYITDSSVLTTAKSKSTGNTADTQSSSSDSNQTTSTEAGQTTQDAYTAADQNSVAQDAGNTDTGNGYYDENGIWVQTY